MKSYRQELWFNIAGRRAFVNITPQVEECLQDSSFLDPLTEGKKIDKGGIFLYYGEG